MAVLGKTSEPGSEAAAREGRLEGEVGSRPCQLLHPSKHQAASLESDPLGMKSRESFGDGVSIDEFPDFQGIAQEQGSRRALARTVRTRDDYYEWLLQAHRFCARRSDRGISG